MLRRAVSFNHKKTNDGELVLRRPFAGHRGWRMASHRIDTHKMEYRIGELDMHDRGQVRAGDLKGQCAVE